MQSEDKQKQVQALTLVKSMKLEAHLISLLSVGSSLILKLITEWQKKKHYNSVQLKVT